MSKRKKAEHPVLYTPLTLVHKVGRGKKPNVCGQVILLRVSYGTQRRPLYVIRPCSRPKPQVKEPKQGEEEAQESENEEDEEPQSSSSNDKGKDKGKDEDQEDEDQEDEEADREANEEEGDKDKRKEKQKKKWLDYDVEWYGSNRRSIAATSQRIAARSIHTRDIAHPRFYFELDQTILYEEKDPDVRDRELREVNDAVVFEDVHDETILVEDSEGVPKKVVRKVSTKTLFVCCKWESKSLTLPQTSTTWEPLDVLLHVQEWWDLLQGFLTGSPQFWTSVGPPEFVANVKDGRCSMLQDPQTMLSLNEWAQEFETYLALQAYNFYRCSVCGKGFQSKANHKEVCVPEYQKLRRKWGK